MLAWVGFICFVYFLGTMHSTEQNIQNHLLTHMYIQNKVFMGCTLLHLFTCHIFGTISTMVLFSFMEPNLDVFLCTSDPTIGFIQGPFWIYRYLIPDSKLPFLQKLKEVNKTKN